MIYIKDFGWRLGNQLFQIANAYAVAKRYQDQLIIPHWSYAKHFRGPFIEGETNFSFVYGETGFNYDEIALYNHQPDQYKRMNVGLSGYFQSEKYFSSYENDIRNMFQMNPNSDVFEEVNQNAGFIASQGVTCSIHARRGDYLNYPDHHPVLTGEWYRRAMSKFHPDTVFWVFSDDMEWVKSNIHAPNVCYQHSSDISDFFTMSLCQPKGTLVKTIDGYKPIEELIIGSRVVAYCDNKGSEKLIGRGDNSPGTPNGREITDISTRQFNGKLVVINTKTSFRTQTSKYTPEHPCIAKLGNSLYNKYLVYLMVKDGQFRVGITSPSNYHHQRKDTRMIGSSDPRRRFNASKADACWILKTFDSKEDALLEESFINSKFGIPQTQFNTKNNNKIETFWERIGDNSINGVSCLREYGRDERLPFITKDNRKKMFDNNTMIINACNLLDGMKVLDAEEYLINGGKGIDTQTWVPIEVSSEYYNDTVYSLTVAINHTYVADGIVTHNCNHHIIANSSFSWWAAWLNPSRTKRVIAPTQWFGRALQHHDTRDLYCQGWEKV